MRDCNSSCRSAIPASVPEPTRERTLWGAIRALVRVGWSELAGDEGVDQARERGDDGGVERRGGAEDLTRGGGMGPRGLDGAGDGVALGDERPGARQRVA